MVAFVWALPETAQVLKNTSYWSAATCIPSHSLNNKRMSYLYITDESCQNYCSFDLNLIIAIRIYFNSNHMRVLRYEFWIEVLRNSILIMNDCM